MAPVQMLVRRPRKTFGAFLACLLWGAPSPAHASCSQLSDVNAPILLSYLHGTRPERHCVWRSGGNAIVSPLDSSGQPRSWTLRQGRYSLEIRNRIPSGTTQIQFQYRDLSHDLDSLKPGETATYEFVASTGDTRMVEQNQVVMLSRGEAVVSGCRLATERMQRVSRAASGVALHFEYDHAPIIRSFVQSTSYRTNADNVRTEAPQTSRLVAIESREEAFAVCGQRPTIFD